MARTKSRAIQVQPDIDHPSKQATPPPPPPPPPAMSAVQRIRNTLNRPSIFENMDYTSDRTDDSDLEDSSTLKKTGSRLASPRSGLASKTHYRRHEKGVFGTAVHNSMTCPNCNAVYDAADLQQYRDHVESCVRRGLVDSDDESVTSQLSTPPASIAGRDSALPTAYSSTELEIYPERREVDDDEDVLPEIRLAKITDVEEFAENLADCENLPIKEIYRRILNAQQVMVEWQDEWIEVEKSVKTYRFPNTISIEEEQEREKGKVRGAPKEGAKPFQKVVNPRALPTRSDDPEKWFPTDDFQLSQDRLEAAVYGYLVKEGAKDIGHQDPLSQRPRRLGQNQRDLRARVPTQKAVQGEMIEESGEESRALAQVTDALLMEGGRGKREKKPSTRVASESRASTPVAAPRGRPPRKNAQIRLQELEAGPTADETMDSTEQWVENVGDADSRPGTSSSIVTGPSSAWDTDDENAEERGVKRKRQDTSDFEGVKKGKKAKTADAPASTFISLAAAAAHARAKTKRSEGARMGWAKRKAEQQHRTSTEATSQGVEEVEGEENADGLPKPAKVEEGAEAKTTPKKYTKKGKKEVEMVVSADGTLVPKKSAATINMERRWAKKREAEALGLEPPKIGRYKKSELAAMKAAQEGQGAETAAGDAASEKKPAGKKRKQSTNNDADEQAVPQNEDVKKTGKGVYKRRKKNIHQPEDGVPDAMVDDAVEAQVSAQSSSKGVKSTSGRKSKKATADTTTDTPATGRHFSRVYDPEYSLVPPPTLDNDDEEEFEDAQESMTPTYSQRKSTGRNSSGKGKKGMKTSSFGQFVPDDGPPACFPPPPKKTNKRKHVTFLDDVDIDEFDVPIAPSGAQTENSETDGVLFPAKKGRLARRKTGPESTVEAQVILPTIAAPLAKGGGAGGGKKSPVLAVERQMSSSVTLGAPAKKSAARSKKGPVTPECESHDSVATGIKEEQVDPSDEGPKIKKGRSGQAKKSPATLQQQTSDLRLAAPPPKKGRNGRAKKSLATPAEPKPDPTVVENPPNPPQADQFAVPEIPRSSARGRRQVSSALFSQDNDALKTLASPAEEEPTKQESGSGSSERPKRNRHPPNKYQVELEETPSTTRQGGRKSSILHEPILNDDMRNASLTTVETPGDSIQPMATKKSSRRSKVELESPVASIEDREDTEPNDPELTAAAKAKEAARAAKSAKMKAITKARWASGEMEAVMARKKANNAAKKAAEAANPGSVSKKVKKLTLKAKSPKAEKRRQTLGNSDKKDKKAHPLAKPPFTTGRKISEYDLYQSLTSPSVSGSPLPPRGRRPAALRASQSFSRYDTNDDEDDSTQAEEPEVAFEDEVEKQINRQFASEYDHYQALASPENTIVLGKRVRKPVMNLKEAMAIEAADDDDDFDE